jgi:hypothetical protein
MESIFNQARRKYSLFLDLYVEINLAVDGNRQIVHGYWIVRFSFQYW